MKQFFYIRKSRNYDVAKIVFYINAPGSAVSLLLVLSIII